MVQAVYKNPATDADIGATYDMERKVPGGAATNELELVRGKPQTEFTIRTLSGPTPFTYRFRFSPYDQTTLVLLDAEVDLGGAADLLAPLVRRAAGGGGAAGRPQKSRAGCRVGRQTRIRWATSRRVLRNDWRNARAFSA